jgi:uncharacterized protein
MSLSMYDASIPFFIRTLTNLSKILGKAIAYAEAKKIDPSVLVNARLAPDMFPLSRQVQIACDMVKGGAARLANVEIPSYADTESTLPELQARIAKTIAFMQSVKPAQVEGSEDRTVTLKVAQKERSFQGKPYLFGFVYPNLHFHATTAYDILRHNGLELGKFDYLGAPE